MTRQRTRTNVAVGLASFLASVAVAVVAVSILTRSPSSPGTSTGPATSVEALVSSTTSAGQGSVSPTSSAPSEGPASTTTASTTTEVSQDAPLPPHRSVIGQIVGVVKDADFAAFRTGSREIAVGPMSITLENGESYEIPARTLIDRRCRQLDIELAGAAPDSSEPDCTVRIDIDQSGDVLYLWVLQSQEDENGTVSTFIVARVTGATQDTVIFEDSVRETEHAWPISKGTVFWCTGDEWVPPDSPSRGATYVLVVDPDTSLVTEMSCRGSF